jgi:uncharacterized membrane protein
MEVVVTTGNIYHTRHKVAENNRQAVKIAVMAGIDIYMVLKTHVL